MRKKLTGLAVATTLALTLVACGSNDAKDNGTQTPVATEAPATEAPAADVNFEEITKKLAETFGDDFVASNPLDAATIEALLGVKADWYEDAYAANSMIGTHKDIVAMIKAKPENVEDVKAALEAYKQAQIDDVMQYPMNAIKVQATRVETYGNYVVLCLVGFVPMEVEETGDDSKILEAFQEENQKAIDVIESYLK